MSNLAPETDLLTAVLQPRPIAVVVTDVCGIVCSINAALTSLTEYSAEEAMGQLVTLLSFNTPEHSFYDIPHQAIRSREAWRGELVCRKKDRGAFIAEQTTTSMKTPNGRSLLLW
jgi:PAS domain S-box-containing protein